MKNLNFIPHTGNNIPVPSSALVVYRTTSEDTPRSHIHAPTYAHKLNWSYRPIIGRILEYAVVMGASANHPFLSKPPSRGRTVNNGSKKRK